MPDDVGGTVNITIGNHTYDNLLINKGIVTLPVYDLGGGNYTVVVTYGGDVNHNGNSTASTFKVLPITPVIKIEVVDIWVGEIEVLNVTVNAPGFVNITVNGITVTLSLDEDVETTEVLAATVLNYNGKATWNIINLPAGTYPAFAFYLGNENYTSVNTVG